ncbi:MAG: hypothetical protein WDO24_05830 [Pseudomonadota bacterium]
MAAALLAIGDGLTSRGCSVRYLDLKPAIRKILERNGFLPAAPSGDSARQSPSPASGKISPTIFMGRAEEWLRGRGIPEMSSALRKEFMRGMGELFVNASMHSKRDTRIYTCGQLFPREQRLNFSIVDKGIGFHGTLSHT